jgi:threonine synthase
MVNVTLGEGHTPLVPSVQIGPKLGLDGLFFKLENTNPSGSYKDRFAACELAHVLASGAKGCLATSSGNTGSALAAYCARYCLPCVILVGTTTPAGKLAQMQAHGARVLRVRDFLSSPSVAQAAFDKLPSIAAGLGLALVVSAYRYCPTGMAGVESLPCELLEQATAIQHVFVPVGGGGLFTAVCRGFQKASAAMPLVHCVQPAGCATVVLAFERGDDTISPIESTTRISGLSVPFDVDAGLALGYLRKSGGQAIAVADDRVFEAQHMLLREEGIYAEPAGAAALAGLLEAHRQGRIKRHQTVICLVTGNGFKDPESIQAVAAQSPATSVEVADLQTTIAGLLQSD